MVVLCCVRKGSAFRAHRLLLRSPGIEPGSSAWQAPIITIRPRATAWKQRTPPACTIHQANTSNSGTGKAHRTSAQARTRTTRTTRTQGQGEHRSRTNERTNEHNTNDTTFYMLHEGDGTKGKGTRYLCICTPQPAWNDAKGLQLGRGRSQVNSSILERKKLLCGDSNEQLASAISGGRNATNETRVLVRLVSFAFGACR